MANTSILVHDLASGQWAYGYQHNTEEIPYTELIDSALSVNKEIEAGEMESIEPVMFLAEWHDLALKQWNDPSEYATAGIDSLMELAKEDDRHYSVKMMDGKIRRIGVYSRGEIFMKVDLAYPV